MPEPVQFLGKYVGKWQGTVKTWFDDFHMSGAILISEGDEIERGFSVSGKYDWAPGQPQGGWRTDYELTDADHLLITADNIMPNGQESKAVETIYERVKE